LAIAAGSWWWWQRSGEPPSRFPIPGEGERITVEVLNGTGIDGLARTMTLSLRAQGIDVVYFGTADNDTMAHTVVFARTDDTTGLGRVLEILGVGTLVTEEDSLLLLDASVYLGLDAARLVGRSP
jgi:hypothetical protein